jgi:hypothetical protein
MQADCQGDTITRQEVDMTLSLHRVFAAFAAPFPAVPARVAESLGLLGWGRRPRRVALDIETAPEPLLRDLGILDGRGPAIRPPEWRRPS